MYEGLLSRRRLCVGLAAGLATTALALPGRARAQVAAAPDAGAWRDLDWVDGTRQRPVPVRLYLPTRGATGARPAALVVFSHGIGGSRRGYSYLGRHFAANGVASLHLQHVGSDRSLWGGSVFGLAGRLVDAAQDAEAVARVQDFSYALDTLLASELAPRVDARRIVAAGHSYGANTTLLAAGAQVSREGRVVALRDERVRAAIVISAPPFYGDGDPQAILAAVTVPSLHVTATEDVIRIPGYYSGAEDRLAVFEATGSARKWLAVFQGGSHSIFTDRRGSGGPLLNGQVKDATKQLSLAFVRTVFGGDDGDLRVWPQQHADILAQFRAPEGVKA